MSIALLGAAIGSLVAGPLSDKYGRKVTTIGADILFTIGAIVMAKASSIGMLVIGRLIVGVSFFWLALLYLLARSGYSCDGSSDLPFGSESI